MSYNFQIGKTYSFSVYPSDLLGNDFARVKVLALMSADVANRSGLDIWARHAQVYPTVPASVGMPNDPTQYNYVELLTQSGNRTILGLPWIDDSSVQLVTSQKALVIIQDVTAEDLPKIRQALAQNNYNNVSLQLQD